MKRIVTACALLGVAFSASAAKADVTLSKIATVPSAVYVTSPPNDSRLFVVGRDGIIWVIRDGDDPTVFMDMRSLVGSPAGSEQGLLSLAFDPDYANNGRFYVNYNATVATGKAFGDVKISEFTNPDPADDEASIASVDELLTIPHDKQGNHNGGTVNFGPDGLLYVSVGDGGSGGDPSGNAQNLDSEMSEMSGVNHSPLLGKILRIDPDGGPVPGQPFSVGTTTSVPQIFAYGLRNPFRWSFDRLTGDLTLGDVGETSFEEVDYVPHAQLVPGINFGWKSREGLHAFSGPLLAGSVETKPVYDYGRSVGSTVIGGYVVRDPDSALYGQYVFGDFGSDKLSAACLGQPTATRVRELGVSVANVNSFGEDAGGRLYVVSNGGDVSRVIATGNEGTCPGPGQPAAQLPAIASPRLSLSASKRQAVVKRGYVQVVAGCDLACSLTARATFKRKGIKKSLNGRQLRRSLAAGQRATLKVKLSKAIRNALKRALRDKRRTTATVTISGTKAPQSVTLTVSG